MSITVEHTTSLSPAQVYSSYKVDDSRDAKQECQACKNREPVTGSQVKTAVCPECGKPYVTESTATSGTAQSSANTYAQMMGKGNNLDLRA